MVNLSIKPEVVKAAKAQGINITDLVEKFLAGFTSAESSKGSVTEAYQEFFSSIRPLLKEFDCKVKIAEGTDKVKCVDEKYETEISIDIFLEADGSFYIDQYDSHFKDIRKIAPRHFLRPARILSNLVNTLARNEEIVKEKITEILMAKNIVDAIYKTLVKKPSTAKEEIKR